MPQKKLKFEDNTASFRGLFDLSERTALLIYHNFPVWIHLSVSEDKPHILGYFRVSSI